KRRATRPPRGRPPARSGHRTSIGARPTVTARVGAGDAHAVRHDADRLHGARPFQMVDALETMAVALEVGQDIGADVRLDGEDAVAFMRPVGALAGLAAGPARPLDG